MVETPYSNHKEILGDLMVYANKVILFFHHKEEEYFNQGQNILEKLVNKINVSNSIALANLLKKFELDSFDFYCIGICLLHELREDYGKVFSNYGNTISVPTIKFAKDSYEHFCGKAVEIERINLIFSGYLGRFFIDTKAYSNINVFDCTLILNKRMFSFMLEPEFKIQSSYKPFLTYYEGIENISGVENTDFINTLFNITSSLEKTKMPIINLYGENGTGRKYHIQRLAKKLNKNLLSVNLCICAAHEKSIYNVLLEAILSNSIICIEDYDQYINSFTSGKNLIYLKNFMQVFCEELGFLIVLSKSRFAIPDFITSNYIFLNFQLDLYTIEDTIKLWEYYGSSIKFEKNIEFKELINRINMSPKAIVEATTSLKRLQSLEDIQISYTQLYQVCMGLIAEDLKKNTTFIEAKHSIEDLILPKDQKQLILHGCNYIKLKNKVYEDWNFKKRFPYGKGLNMLFAGPPGTGKTMAAQIISKELSLPMYRLELSRTVSKYIGETEENLRIIFDAAQKSNIILFIDEMDALFGKRSEVKSSKDRYSNMETSYLLQRLEQYDGVVLMATNYLTNIDEAFMRRIHFIVHFPFPDQESRMYLWKTIFPPSAPLKKDIDFRFLSEKFELSGGSIKNIALKSAFLAAAQNKAISMTHIIPSVVDEMSKQGKIILKEDFAEFSYLVK